MASLQGAGGHKGLQKEAKSPLMIPLFMETYLARQIMPRTSVRFVPPLGQHRGGKMTDLHGQWRASMRDYKLLPGEYQLLRMGERASIRGTVLTRSQK